MPPKVNDFDPWLTPSCKPWLITWMAMDSYLSTGCPNLAQWKVLTNFWPFLNPSWPFRNCGSLYLSSVKFGWPKNRAALWPNLFANKLIVNQIFCIPIIFCLPNYLIFVIYIKCALKWPFSRFCISLEK